MKTFDKRDDFSPSVPSNREKSPLFKEPEQPALVPFGEQPAPVPFEEPPHEWTAEQRNIEIDIRHYAGILVGYFMKVKDGPDRVRALETLEQAVQLSIKELIS